MHERFPRRPPCTPRVARRASRITPFHQTAITAPGVEVPPVTTQQLRPLTHARTHAHAHSRNHGAGVEVPSITIEYRDLTVEADALVGGAALPTLTNTLVGFIKARVRRVRVCACVCRRVCVCDAAQTRCVHMSDT